MSGDDCGEDRCQNDRCAIRVYRSQAEHANRHHSGACDEEQDNSSEFTHAIT
jgi:hypothetical protein